MIRRLFGKIELTSTGLDETEVIPSRYNLDEVADDELTGYGANFDYEEVLLGAACDLTGVSPEVIRLLY